MVAPGGQGCLRLDGFAWAGDLPYYQYARANTRLHCPSAALRPHDMAPPRSTPGATLLRTARNTITPPVRRRDTAGSHLWPVLLLIGAALIAGPPTPGTAQSHGDNANIFLDCDRCDFSYIRREVPFVNWVRDREDAIVHVLVTDSRTAAGGREYNLNFLGLKQQEGTDQSLRYVAPPDYTDDEERRGLAGILKVGLLPYLAQFPVLSRLSVSYDGDVEDAGPQLAMDDPWDSWVFEIEGGGRVEKETSRRELSVDASLSANRVTEQWRIRNWFDFEYDEDRFETSDTTTSSSSSHEWRYWGGVTRSLGPHWSVGISGSLYADTYDNTDLALRLTPALEYSYWSYDQDQRRRLTLAYRIGQRSINYVERTIYGKTSETRFDQSLNIDLGLTQPWGSVRTSLSGSHYFHDMNRYRVRLFSRLSVRLLRGLSLNLAGGVERVNDQLNLPIGELTLEEILLQRREQATDYELWSRASLSYTFGSIYNSVVNTRL